MRAGICLVFLTHTTSLEHSNILVPFNVSTVIVSVWFHIFVTRIMKFIYKKGRFFLQANIAFVATTVDSIYDNTEGLWKPVFSLSTFPIHANALNLCN